MKKTGILLLMMALTQCLVAQSASHVSNPFPKTITVSGSAEMEVIPDEIYVNITLREYQKKGDNKKDLETIKSQFLEHCKMVGIPDSAISISSYTGYNSYYLLRKKKKDPDMMAAIVYQVKFRDSKAMDALVEKLDDEATQAFVIAATSHSKMTEFRKQLKIKAVQAAKDKGIYLTEAINEKLGAAITVTEPEDHQVAPMNYLAGRVSGVNVVSNYTTSFAQDYKAADYEVDFKKIKLRFEVTVIFALQ